MKEVCARVRGERESVYKIASGVRIAHADGLLRAGQNYRLRAVLYEVGKGGSGISHRVRAVRYHETVVLPVVFFNAVGDRKPVSVIQIRAVQIEKLYRVYLAETRDFGHIRQNFFGCHKRGEPAFRHARSYCAARSDK